MNEAVPLCGDEPVARCYTFSLKLNEGMKGSLVALEFATTVPFQVARVFTIFDVPKDTTRGFHANRYLHEVLVAFNGSVTVTLRGSVATRTFGLSSPATALYIHPMTWLEMTDFTPGTVLVVLASHPYEADSHVCDFETYLSMLGEQGAVL